MNVKKVTRKDLLEELSKVKADILSLKEPDSNVDPARLRHFQNKKLVLIAKRQDIKEELAKTNPILRCSQTGRDLIDKGIIFGLFTEITQRSEILNYEHFKDLLSEVKSLSSMDLELVDEVKMIISCVEGLVKRNGQKQIFPISLDIGGFNLNYCGKRLSYQIIDDITMSVDTNGIFKVTKSYQGFDFGPINFINLYRKILDIKGQSSNNVVRVDISKFTNANQRKIVGDFLVLVCGDRNIDAFCSEAIIYNSKTLST